MVSYSNNIKIFLLDIQILKLLNYLSPICTMDIKSVQTSVKLAGFCAVKIWDHKILF